MKRDKNIFNLSFKDRSDLLNECKNLISKSEVLDPILQEIKNLKRGEVTPESTLRRSEIGSCFTSEIQQIFNYIYNHRIVIDEEIESELSEIIRKADAVLRENIVLQSKPPIDVIKFENVPVRYSHSPSGGREQRWGYGLHKRPTTEQGYSITMALMPPRYIQSYHNHTISEYTLSLDKETVGFYCDGEYKREKVAHRDEIIYFSATTPHTLCNPTDSFSRNITVKRPTGLVDWRPINNLHPVKSIGSKILTGERSPLEVERGTIIGTKIFFTIKDEYYDYELKILEIKENSIMNCMYNEDKYFLVVEGELLISSGDIKKDCNKNDYIVIDENTNFKIETKTETKLYTVKIRT